MTAISIGTTEAGADLRLDVARLIDSRMLIQGNSGAGKSRLLRRIAEQAHGQVQIVILDPEGEFSTLRERHDYLLVGKGGEVPTEPRAATLLARRLLELRVSAVVDLYELRLDGRREFIRLFLESLLALPKELYRSLVVAIDEAHMFCPEAKSGSAVSTDSVIALMSQGRKRGLCGVLLTQRLSKLHKDAAAECNNVAIGRTWLDVDQKRAADVLGMTAHERQSLRDLGAGEFLAFGPAFSHNGVVQFRGGEVLTTHPTAGKRHKVEPPAPSAAIRSLLDELRDLPQQAAEEIRTLAAAQVRVKQLERELRAAAKAVPPPPPPAPKPERVEVLVLKDAQATRLEKATDRLGGVAASLLEVSREITAALARVANQPVLRPAPVAKAVAPAVPRKPAAPREPRPFSLSAAMAAATNHLPQGERRVLTAVAQYPEGVSRDQLSILTGFKRSTRDAYLQRLRTRELIDQDGAMIQATDLGVATLGDSFEPLPTGDELRSYWLSRLPEGERAILSALCSVYPDAMERTALEDTTGYKRSTRDAYLQRLSARRLVKLSGRGSVVAVPELFG